MGAEVTDELPNAKSSEVSPTESGESDETEQSMKYSQAEPEASGEGKPENSELSGEDQITEPVEPTEDSDFSEGDPEQSFDSELEQPTEDSELSEEEPEDSDEPTNDEAITPEEDHYFWHCHRYTGGTCSWFRCSHWRHAHCHHGRCVCGWGKCAWHGRCLWQSEMTAEEDEIVA